MTETERQIWVAAFAAASVDATARASHLGEFFATKCACEAVQTFREARADRLDPQVAEMLNEMREGT